MKIPLFLVAVVALHGVALATVTDDLIESLKDELRMVPRDAKGSFDRFKVDQLAALLAKTERDETANESLLTTLEQLSLTGPTDNLRALAKTLGRELKKEQAAREAAQIAELRKTIADAVKRTLAAKTPTELDEPFAAVNKLLRGNPRFTRAGTAGTITQLNQQLGQAANLIRLFQDYLTWLNAEGPRRTRPYLSLSGEFDLSEFVPRSEILLRIKELEKLGEATGADPEVSAEQWSKKVNELIASVRTLDDLSGTLKGIDALRAPSSSYSFGTRSTDIDDLRSFSTTYDQLKRGQATSIMLPNPTAHPGPHTAVLQTVRDQLIALALPRLLVLPEGTALKPGETPLTFLQRTLAQAKEKRDWPLLGRVVDIAQRFSLQVGTVTSDATALTLFLAGYNQDRAQQYTQATTSYLATLKTGSQIVPPEYVGELLAALKKSHREEYDTASKAFDEAYLRTQTGGSAAGSTSFRIPFETTPAPNVTVPAKGVEAPGVK
jgi:hypothetical protein